MPLARYQIRNEYGLADPELYKAADKDDPEALLEGVAMAGLVGVLRQLGDLAEFAAEVFHDLHEEVMATAARGHGLMARVQQLEAEVPSIEKVFLSQNDQAPFFNNSGVDWHPNFRMEQNLITRGDLPRFVMDSYEECRAPPRLFLLDKFDVAGAGACLKRYTDPSVFKVEIESSGIEGQRERKIRKVKKKGSRWRNGETPEVVPTSHAKLHQLFLEERVENGHSDPARLVKLKRRQLHGSPFDLKPGKSYMEKFVGSPSPEHKVVCEVSVNQSPLRLTMDNYSESGLEILDIGTVSPARKSLQGRESSGSSPNVQEVVLKSFTDELDEEVITREIVKVHDPTTEDDASPRSIHKEAIDDELAVNGDRKIDDSLDGDQSDDLISEVDNYMDALTTMESEMDTDNEYKPKDAHNFLKFRRQGAGSDASDRHPGVHTNFSDSQSFGNSSVSDDGKSSFKKGRSSFSYSDTVYSNTAENMQSDSEGAGKVSPYDESCTAEIMDSPLDHTSRHVENVGSVSTKDTLYDNIDNEEATISNSGEASGSSYLPDSNSLAENAPDELPSEYIKLSRKSLTNDQNDKNLMDSSIPAVSSEACLREEVKPEDPNMSVQNSNVSDLEREVVDGYANEIVQRDHADGFDDKSMVEAESMAPHPVIAPSVYPEVDEDAGLKEVLSGSDIVNHDEMDSAVNDFSAAIVDLEILTGMVEPLEAGSMKEQSLDTAVAVFGDEHELTEIESKVDVVDRDTIQFENQANNSDKPGLGDPANLNENVIASHVDVATGGKDDASDAHCVASDLVCSPSSGLVDILEYLPRNQDSYEQELPINEVVLPEHCMESQEQKEVTQLDVASTNINPSSHQYAGCSNVDVLEHVHESTHPDQTQNKNTSYTADASTLSSAEFNSQDMKSQLSFSIDSSGVASSSPDCHLPEVETALGHLVELPPDQNLAESSFAAIDEGDSETFDLQQSPACHIEEHGVPSERSMELYSADFGAVCLQANETSSELSVLQSEQMVTMSSIGRERCGDAASEQDTLPCQELLIQPAAEEVNGTVLSHNPFESGFPSFSSVPQNSEELPPLPPLPPMQWRLGKFQPAAMLLHAEWVHLGQDGLLSTQPFTNEENSQNDSVLLGRETIQPSNDDLSDTSADIQRSRNSLEESVESPLQPTSQLLETPMNATDGNKLQGSLSEEGAQFLNPFLNSLEVTNEGPDYGSLASRESPVELSADPSSSMATVEHTQTERDRELSHGQEIKNLNQIAPESVSEAKTPEISVQNVEVGERNSVDKSVSSSTLLEDQPQHDLVPLSLAEPSWLQNTLALPPTYEAGKPNGHKLPRPRNPLIDAVAAHDKSKLRKVAERVRPQLGQKAEERDSLLEQIRNQSFNLKPTTVTRPPSIQGMQGPKTNLRVAAILEKANAIRQALAGSDEDEDSDSWSDS